MSGPDSIRLQINQAIALQQAGDLVNAEALYLAILAQSPRHFDALHMMGAIGLQRYEAEKALPWLQQALAVYEADDALHFHLALAYLAQKLWPQAYTHVRRSLALNPHHPQAWVHCGGIEIAMGDVSKGLASMGNAVALEPLNVDGQYRYALALGDQFHFQEALAALDRTLALQPDLANARWNRAFLALMLGRYEEGWADYEWRWRADLKMSKIETNRPEWNGKSSLVDKTVFLLCEQGSGDTLQFCRYVPMLQAAGAKVLMGVQTGLEALLRTLPGNPKVLQWGETIPHFDLACHIMSLPRLFGTTLATIPAQVPYLWANAEKRAAWRARLGPRSRPRWGLAWSGDPKHGNDAKRSIPLADWLPHLRPDIEWISLQPVVRERDQPALAQSPIRPLGAELQSFEDTAALCAELDGVISVDTSVAHLAGALGQPLKVLVPRYPDWRWLLAREDSPWYPSATLYRVGADGSWSTVIAQAMASFDTAVTA